MHQNIHKIIAAGIAAPSGDNIQPWRFKVEGSKILIYVTPEGGESLYDFRRLASYFSVGAVVENMQIEAECLGYEVLVEPFPSNNCVAQISLRESVRHREAVLDALRSVRAAIFTRATNRKKYAAQSLTEEDLHAILQAPKMTGQAGHVYVVSEKESIARIAKLFSYTIGLVFKEKSIHQSLYTYLVWSESKLRKMKSGLYVKTLELPLLLQIGMWFSQAWLFVKVGMVFKMARLSEMIRERVFSNTAACGVVVMKNNQPIDFFMGGRIFQRLWLEAVAQGLSLHPQYSYVALEQVIAADEAESLLSGETIDTAKQNIVTLKRELGVSDGGVPVMYFRLGKAAAPTALSPRKSVAEMLVE